MQNATRRFRSQSETCVHSRRVANIIASIFFNCHGREVCVTFVRRLSQSNDLTCESLPLFSACSRASFSPARGSFPVEFSARLKRDTTKALSNTLSRGYDAGDEAISASTNDRNHCQKSNKERERERDTHVCNKVRGGTRCVARECTETPITTSLRTHRRDD